LDWSLILSAVVGAVFGAIFTAGGTWWVSVRLDRQNQLRQLRSAIRIVATELSENGERAAQAGDNPDSVRKRLLLGDWEASKTAFAGLFPRNEQLWTDVARTYGQIFNFKSRWPGSNPPTVEQLCDLVSRLRDDEQEIDKEIRSFSRFLP
jgi:hypothetical protein